MASTAEKAYFVLGVFGLVSIILRLALIQFKTCNNINYLSKKSLNFDQEANCVHSRTAN